MNRKDSVKIQPPQWLRLLYGGAFWRGNSRNRSVYLTFDDGPIPGPTEWILDLLARHQIQATFFCVGHNVEKHPKIHQAILAAGHATGNHTHHHKPAFKTLSGEWFQNIAQCHALMQTDLFRPPHGQLYPWQLFRLKKMFRRVVMWDVMPLDYEAKLTGEQVFEHVKQYVRPGSVLVFHDSHKAFDRVKIALPLTIEHLLQQGYTFQKL